MLLANTTMKLTPRVSSPQALLEKSLLDLNVKADKGLSLKERLNRSKQERLNEDVSKIRLVLLVP